MAIDNITPKNTIKGWFKRGVKPMEAQFHAWMDSYWHKSEPIPTATIEGLETILNSKAETADITSIRTGMEEHANDDTRHKTATEQSKLNNLADNADATYARKVRLEDLETDMAEQDAAGLQAAKDYTDALAENVYKKAETDNKYVFKTDMPTALKNPNAITFTGAVSEIYDGSVAKTVNIPAGLSLGETASTAYRGDRGKIAYDYSQSKRSKADLDSTLQTEINSKVNTTDPRLSNARPANGGTADYMPCKDVRTIGYSPNPNQVASERVSSLFNNSEKPGNSEWYSELVVKGWTKDYFAWKLAANASNISSNDNNLYFRNGIGETWNEWKKIAFSGETQPASDVYAWAKAATKPTYSAAEIGAVSSVNNRAVNDCNDFVTNGMFGFNNIPVNGPGPSYLSMLVVKNIEVGYQLAGGHYSDRLYFRGIGPGAIFRSWLTIAFLSDIPTNYVTLDTAQTITGTKTFSTAVTGRAGFYDTSDRRLKENIKPIELNPEKIKLYEFDKEERHSYGVIAQEVEAVYPSVVQEGEDGYKTVNYNEVLVIKCAEQDKRIEVLEKESDGLRLRLERLEQLFLK